MNTQPPLKGAIIPMVTPFTPDGQLDEDGAANMIEHIASNGLGIFILGTTGEAASVAPNDRRSLVKIALRIAGGRVPVLAGISGNLVSASSAAAADYHRLGVDAVVAHLPSYYKLTPEEIARYFLDLADEIPGNLLAYNIPQTTHMSIPVDIVERIAKHPKIVGFKDSEPCASRMEMIAAAFAKRADFAIFMGSSYLSTAAMRCGFDGVVPSTGNLVPSMWREFCVAAEKGFWDQAEELQSRLNIVATVIQDGRTLGQSLAILKAALFERGLCGPTVQRPLLAADPEAIQYILAALASASDPNLSIATAS